MISATDVDGWLRELDLEPIDTADRAGVRSWDLQLDGRMRSGVPMTLIFDPTVGAVVWVQYAPPLADSLRKVYHQMLRWNDDLPFVKFALGEDDQPVLSDEIASAGLSRDALGLTIARLLAICDLLYPDSRRWVDRIVAREHSVDEAGRRLLDRYAAGLGELAAEAP